MLTRIDKVSQPVLLLLLTTLVSTLSIAQEVAAPIRKAAVIAEASLASAKAASISAMCFSPDTARAITIKANYSLTLRDPHTGNPILDLGQFNGILACAASPSGESFAAIAKLEAPHLLVLDKDNTTLLSIQPPYRNFHYLVPKTVAFSPGGRFLAFQYPYLEPRRTTTPATSVHVWDVASGTELLELKPFPNGFSDLWISADGRTLAGASNNGHVAIWDMQSKEQRNRIELPQPQAAVIALSEDGGLLAAAQGMTIWVWDVASKTLVATYDSAGEIVGIGLTAERLVFGDRQGRISVKALKP